MRDTAEPSTLYLVKRLELAIRAVLDDVLRPHGLTAPQYTALTALAQRDRAHDVALTSAQLARRSFVTPQTMHEQVLTLERAGLLGREHDPSNRRVLRIRLTDQGRDRLRDCAGVVAELEGLVEGALGDGGTTRFRDALDRALTAVEPATRRGGVSPVVTGHPPTGKP